MIYQKTHLLLLYIFSICFSQYVFSQENVDRTIQINANNIKLTSDVKGSLLNNSTWKYTLIDNNKWIVTAPDLTWKSVQFPLDNELIEKINFTGVAWFYNTFQIDSAQVDKNFTLQLSQTGASEIYIDGKLFQQFGKPSKSINEEKLRNPQSIPFQISFDEQGVHVIVIRYGNNNGFSNAKFLNNLRKWLIVSLTEETLHDKIFDSILGKTKNVFVGIISGIFFLLSIINLMFFLFYKKEKSNLYFSFFSFASLLVCILPTISDVIPFPIIYSWFDNMTVIVTSISNVFLMLLIFNFTHKKLPKRFYFYLALSVISLLTLLISFSIGYNTSTVIYFVIYIDVIIQFFRFSLKKYDENKKKRKVIFWVLIGLIVTAIMFLFIESKVSIVIFALILLTFILPILGFIFIVPVFMIIKQAKSFARINVQLEEQLIQVKDLSEKTIAQEKEKQQLLADQNNLLEDQVKQRTRELQHKNQEITDSIQYASRIQKALLVDKKTIDESLKNQFILFKPKDIVSGDFYFFAKHEQYIFLAAADCTGHGVPGSLMSMIGHEKLQNALSFSNEPGKILQLINKGIKETLNQKNNETATRDGMDIALTRIDLQTGKVIYAAANRPLWYIRNGVNEIQEIKATKKAIAGFTDDSEIFEEHQLSFTSGDTYYIFSDGYADQFGQNGKKLMTKKFKELLLSIQYLQMKEQEKFLNDYIENWRAGQEQVDDILVIGIRF
jgi:serine phosphatase RsbU (regulator of sigma subunit)